MIPVRQTKFGKEGNCYAACFASLLEIPIEAVPDLNLETRLEQLKHVDKWLRVMYDCALLGFEVKDFYCIPPVYHIITGKSPRGLCHAVVGFRGEIAHDPHPSDVGLAVEAYEFLIRRIK